MAIYTTNGVEIQKIEGILKNLQDIAKRRFADVLAEGETLSVDASSVLGRILGIVAEPDALNEELLLMLWQSLDIDQAEGADLDKLLKLIGITRKQPQEAIANLTLRGDIGVTVIAGSSVGSTITGDRFVIDSDVTFNTTSCNGVVIDIKSITPQEKYTVQFVANESGNEYPPITTVAQEGDTEEVLANRLAQVINNLSTVVKAEVDNDDRIIVKYINANTVGSFTVTSNMDIVESYMLATSYSATFTAVKQLANTLNVIQTATLGWREVYNPFDSIASRAAETDTELRNRAKIQKGNDSVGSRQAMYGDLMAVDGVRYVGIKENIYDTELEGRGAHGVSVYVLGGSEDDIFASINSNIAAGTMMDGTIQRTMEDEAGTYELAFSRVELVPIEIKLSIVASYNFEADGFVKIQDAIVAYFESLGVGEDVVWSRLFTPINSVKGMDVSSLRIGVKGGELSQDTVEILPNQLAVISFEDIKI